jgi:AraC family transcriptional regulator
VCLKGVRDSLLLRIGVLIYQPAKQLGASGNRSILTLALGAFFGSANRILETTSFQFSELEATVPEREVPRHTHETPHFVLVLRGVYSTEACKRGELYSSSSLIFNPAGTTHRDCFRSPQGRFLSISPGPEVSKFLRRAPSFARVVSGGVRNSADILRVVGQIVREFEREVNPSAVMLEGLGLELIGLLAEAESRPESRYIPDWLVRAKEMMEDCAGNDFTIADLAATASVHPVYLARAFRRHFGNTPGEYLRRNRLRRVQRLLADTHLPLVEVALQCGFSDQSRMTHAFTSEFGVAPGQYRRMYLE